MRTCKHSILGLLITLFLITATHAQTNQIKVLLVKAPSVSAVFAVDMLDEMNGTMDNSNLDSYEFVSAKTQFGLPVVVDTECDDTDADYLTWCLEEEMESERNNNSADIVIALAPYLELPTEGNICGKVQDEVINAPAISWAVQGDAYAVIDLACFLAGELFVVSHEIGHLLYIEHVTDSQPLLPVSFSSLESVTKNHAKISAAGNATVTALNGDFGCSNGPDGECVFHQIYSGENLNFPGGSSAGEPDYSDAVDVIENDSWTVVAGYRPIPTVEPCHLRYEFATCNGTIAIGNVTATLGGYTVDLADFDFSTNSGATWNDLYTGLVTCPGAPVNPSLFSRVRAILTTAYGISQCEIPITINNCESGGGGPNPF